MAETQQIPVTVLGLGAVGQAMAATLLKAGRASTVWNRTAGKDADLVAAGATSVASVAAAHGIDYLDRASWPCPR
ncbi:NAD(P)-binding domain-containing protein [Nocardia sp. NPDC051463]|uniref:NAD(P)-binding domain-containing protein n=1 Tax=Nocardia sp. NPDC051463 TaxID=3154845 RepID=UPI00344F922C